PAFQSCVSHGIVLGNDGMKMSKSLRNYPDVREVFDRDGADAMRWFLMSSPILRGGNLIVTEEHIRGGVRQALIPLWNSWYFFSLYANAAGYEATWSTESTDQLDRYILAKLGDYVRGSEQAQDVYDIAKACDLTRDFLELLTNWYIRRNRDRFWAADGTVSESTRMGFDTLFTVLETVCRVAAPLLPLVTEEVWRGLTGERSVHLSDWPDADLFPTDAKLVEAMDRVQSVCSTVSALRKAQGLRVRQPLGGLTLVTPSADLVAGLSSIVRDELNVKEVTVVDVDQAADTDFGIVQRLTVNARAAGPRLGRDVQQAIKGSKSGDWSVAEDGTVTSGGITLQEGEYALETVVDDRAGGDGPGDGTQLTAVLPGGGFVVLDATVTPELAREGLARDLVRAVQQARKDAGLEVSDRISLTVTGSEAVLDATIAHRDLIVAETLATQFGSSGSIDDLPAGDGVTEATVGADERVRIKLARI
ncbi:MAG TPA: class I tRNA ligase family protein, partial [Intrasporangiaceae bacterium]|nr:class I tRNA ligase family protein [Intrasporangiaceae bacterium]